MTRFTALDNPLLEQKVEAHLQRIVAEVTARMNPVAIILRGSFGRGEGSVVLCNGQPRFLSDYEIDVATFSPFYRSLFRELSCRLTAALGVETSFRWVRPDYLYRNRVGPLPMGAAPITISLYESRYGSQTLYGQDLLETARVINPRDIRAESAAYLVLNRMAESLSYMRWSENRLADPWMAYYWINKTILACAESLLLLWGRYHFSYAERGRRFATTAEDDLAFMGEEGVILCDLVARATEFKLRPDLSLYPEPVDDAWRRVVPICDNVFRYVARQAFDLYFNDYSEFPKKFLRRAADAYCTLPLLHRGALTLLDLYKWLRVRRLSTVLLSPFTTSSAVYAIVPLTFISWATRDETLPVLLTDIRRQLHTLYRIDGAVSDLPGEWDALRRQVLWAWKNFCYR